MLKLKNWKLSLLTLFFIVLFVRLGFWQLSRADEKKQLFATFATRTQIAPLHAAELETINDARFYHVKLKGKFDNQHVILLDNKTSHGQVGYEIYTPFFAMGLETPILIDRGFVVGGATRRVLPEVMAIPGKTTVHGILNVPPTYVSFGNMYEKISWPLRVEYLHLNNLAKLIYAKNNGFFPYILTIETKNRSDYSSEWQATIMTPERHTGYAVQWFALALTLLILSLILNRRSST